MPDSRTTFPYGTGDTFQHTIPWDLYIGIFINLIRFALLPAFILQIVFCHQVHPLACDSP